MIFFIATGNKNKKKEFERILLPLGIEIKTADELGFTLEEVEETGKTFEENSMLKAESGLKQSGYPTLADDSGICVDYLNGEPGIYSARYSGVNGEHGQDESNNTKLLKNLENVPLEKRTAHYACAISVCFPDGRKKTVLGTCEGKIGFERKGNGGFGYDPLFIYGEGNRTFGEMSPEEKDKVSHRRNALYKMYEYLEEEINNDRKRESN